jgi:voltage-gated potassium channel
MPRRIEIGHFNRLLLPLLLILLLVGFGIGGYMLIEGYTFVEALYMTIITIGSVGYEEVHPLSKGGMIFTTVLIILNLAVFTIFITMITRYFADGEFQREYKFLTMQERIEKLHNHVIICGLGRNGQEAAQVLHTNQIPFVVLEEKEIEPNLPFELKYFLTGDARNDDVLQQAGINKARALITTLPNDADNLYVVLTARQENPGLRIISRASQISSVNKLKIAGATNVIMPDKIGGAHMATLVMHPDIHELISLMTTRNNAGFRIEELAVKIHQPLGKLNLWQATGCTVLGIKHQKDYLLNPPPEHELMTGQSIIVMGSEVQIRRVREMI